MENKAGGLGSLGARQSASDVIDDLINRYRREADRLESLKLFVNGIEGDAEAALWNLVINFRR